MKVIILIILVTLLLLLSSGCSGGSPVSVEGYEVSSQPHTKAGAQNHLLWGLWTIRGNADGSGFEVIPLRETQLHLNALVFLEPPPNQFLKIEGAFVKWGFLNVDIGLRHPFLAQPQFTGFDVKGIVILPGTEDRCTSDYVTLPSVGETRLINADGYTRWWNPREFPQEEEYLPIFGYVDGLLGTPYEVAQFASTLNGYKYFADDLSLNQPVWELDPSKRGMFSSSGYNRRRYKFKVKGPELVFNYAVDASWAIPNHIPPLNVPDDFPIHANQAEPYAFKVGEVKNTLYNDGFWGGGDYELEVTVYTWRPLDTVKHVSMEIPGAFGPVGSETPIESGEGWAKYLLKAHAAAPIHSGECQVLVRAACAPWKNYNERLYATPLSAFYLMQTAVGTQPPGGPAGTVKGFHYYEPTEYEGYSTSPGPAPGTYGAADSRDGHIGVLTGKGDPYGDPYIIESVDGGNVFEPKYVCYGWLYSGNMVYGLDGEVHAIGGLVYMHRPPGFAKFECMLVWDDLSISNFCRTAIELDDTTGRLHLFTVSQDRKYIYHLYSDDYENFSEPIVVVATPLSGFGHYYKGIGMRSHIFPDGTFSFLTVEYEGDLGDHEMHVYYRSGPVDDIGPPVQVDAGMPVAFKSFPELVVDPAGVMHTAWLDAGPNVDEPVYPDLRFNQIYYSFSYDGVNFSTPSRLTYRGATNRIYGMVMHLNGAGLPVIIYPVFGTMPVYHHDTTRLRIRQITIDGGLHPLAPVDIFYEIPEPLTSIGYRMHDLSTATIDANRNIVFWYFHGSLYSSPIDWQYY